VCEVADFGSNWITGVTNHDTLRRGGQRGVQTSWEDDPINPHLGEIPQDIIDAAYDSPAANALMHCFLPGVPMDFLNANFRGPWGFVRDTDAPWNVKVVADEHNVAEWQIRDRDYRDERHFPRLKELGFDDPGTLRWFMHTLYDTVSATDYDPERMAAMLAPLDPPLGDGDPTPVDLQRFGYAWMRDFHEFANSGTGSTDRTTRGPRSTAQWGSSARSARGSARTSTTTDPKPSTIATRPTGPCSTTATAPLPTGTSRCSSSRTWRASRRSRSPRNSRSRASPPTGGNWSLPPRTSTP
jgi:hypothetical protein